MTWWGWFIVGVIVGNAIGVVVWIGLCWISERRPPARSVPRKNESWIVWDFPTRPMVLPAKLHFVLNDTERSINDLVLTPPYRDIDESSRRLLEPPEFNYGR